MMRRTIAFDGGAAAGEEEAAAAAGVARSVMVGSMGNAGPPQAG
jgi:hypothetical protein